MGNLFSSGVYLLNITFLFQLGTIIRKLLATIGKDFITFLFIHHEYPYCIIININQLLNLLSPTLRLHIWFIKLSISTKWSHLNYIFLYNNSPKIDNTDKSIKVNTLKSGVLNIAGNL